MINYADSNLTQHPPRSPRVRLGGFVHLPRLLDKARATLAGKPGEYIFGSKLDQQFFEFTGVDSASFLDAVKTGKSDGEMLAWVLNRLQPRRVACEIAQWSVWMETLGPGSAAGHTWLAGRITSYGPQREDIRTYFDHLDLDDYVAFGGRS